MRRTPANAASPAELASTALTARVAHGACAWRQAIWIRASGDVERDRRHRPKEEQSTDGVVIDLVESPRRLLPSTPPTPHTYTYTRATMADLFESYSSDFEQLLSSIRGHLTKTLPSQSGEARKSTLRRCEMELDEAEEILSQMDVEVQGFPQSVRSKYGVTMRGFRGELQKVAGEVRKASGGAGDYDAANPFSDERGGGDVEANNDTHAQRQRLLQGSATLEDGTRRLEESNRIALETEDLGADILRDLRGQREQIEHSRDTLRTADSSLDRSSKTLTKMIRR